MDMVTEISYQNCLKSMYGLRRFGIKLGLSTIRKILAGLDNPQNSCACIHVAGTNGKGSVASSLASILTRAGYKTGLYTSPHLVDFNERIQVDHRPISDTNVLAAYKAIRKVHSGDREPTFFEFATVMAFFEFARQNVDWAIIETGMGGRLDATNIIRPRISIITNISLEHRDYLGSTLEQISGEKAGIIKNRTPVITGIRQKKALAVVKKTARDKSAPLYCFGKDFKVRRHASGTFSYYGLAATWHGLKTGLLGQHQVDNAALVLAACELLKDRHLPLALEDIQIGLIQNHWPGRLEMVSDKPRIILDGAHNFIAARNLARFLSTNLSSRNITMIIGILDDKPYRAMLKCLLPTANRVILTRAKINRAMEPEKLEPIAKNILPAVTVISDVKQALASAIESARPNDVICVAGSLYVVGEAKEALDTGLLQKPGPPK
ncbi:MAG: bifunctional folylpolyglutamate synthase/dihydrofolate synthase [Desulfobacterales bacterium]